MATQLPSTHLQLMACPLIRMSDSCCLSCSLTATVQVGQLVTIVEASDVQKAAELRNAPGYVVVAPADWHIIPAENLVAAFQVRQGLHLHYKIWH